MRTSKASAAARTVDMFAPAELPVSTEDTADETKVAETIEQVADRGRDKAFETAEFLSKRWGEVIDGGTYRLTLRGDLMLLDQFRHNGKESGAYGWTGVMFPKRDLYELTGVLVKASKRLQAEQGQ